MSVPSLLLTCGARQLDLSSPHVMGILNVTPDSFSDGGCFVTVGRAIDHAASMLAEGATLIDVGGESTRPGAVAVSASEELDRVIPVIEALQERFDVVVSVDTSAPEVMSAAANAGAGMLNDVRGFARPGAVSVAAKTGLAVCVMHMQGEPATMQQAPRYRDVVDDVVSFLSERTASLVANGVDPALVIVDPGFGFGKTLDQNFALLRGLPVLRALGFPVLAGLSRKSMIGQVTGKPVGERQAGSVAAALLAFQNGASIVRVHDVAATVDALKIFRKFQDTSHEQALFRH